MGPSRIKKKESSRNSNCTKTKKLSAADEIGAIFSKINKKSSTSKISEISNCKENLIQKPKIANSMTNVAKKDFYYKQVRPIRYTDDGLPVYRPEDLGIGKLSKINDLILRLNFLGSGGGTPNCPFDCDCCY